VFLDTWYTLYMYVRVQWLIKKYSKYNTWKLSQLAKHFISIQNSDSVNEWLLVNANSVIFQLYHGENNWVNFQWDGVRIVLNQHA
jgi:hypothetical protein